MHLRRSDNRGIPHAITTVAITLMFLSLFLVGGQYPVVAGDPASQPIAAPDSDAGIPMRLKIPAINVDAAIEAVGLTSDNVMGVPEAYNEAAWYRLGPRPGQWGNAVISGHVDSTTGFALFWNLHKLVPGDTISVVGDDGIERRFVVSALERYTTENAPLTRIFGAADGAHLNLITCDADTLFDRASGSYSGYLLVYADAVE